MPEANEFYDILLFHVDRQLYDSPNFYFKGLQLFSVFTLVC